MTEVARTAKPLIAALDRYSMEHAKAPENLAAVAPYLTGDFRKQALTSNGMVNGWTYDVPARGNASKKDAKPAYSITRPLDVDPFLRYRFDGEKGVWEFASFDGRDPKILRLNP